MDYVHSADNSAFLVIDLQPVFTDTIRDESYQHTVKRNLDAARKLLCPDRIIHVRANYGNTPMLTRSRILHPDTIQPTDTTGTLWAAELEDEKVIEKTTVDAFYLTDLENYLRERNITSLFCCGMLTCCCVHETAIGGVLRGFRTVLVEDLCIDKTPEKHTATLMLYKDYMYETCLAVDMLVLLGSAR